MPTAIKFRRLAEELISHYLTHQSWKAHEGLFMPPWTEPAKSSGRAAARGEENRRRSLRKLAGVRLSESEARAVWPQVLEHKWYMGERLGRDVGLRVAAVDYFENVRRPQAGAARRAKGGGLPPRLPMMMSLGQRS